MKVHTKYLSIQDDSAIEKPTHLKSDVLICAQRKSAAFLFFIFPDFKIFRESKEDMPCGTLK